MKTEEMPRTPRGGDAHELSRALQDLTPLSCAIVDSRGKPVPLTSAGFLLRFGQSYRLRIALPFQDEDLQEVAVINPPGLITVGKELREVDGQGRKVHSIPLKVSLDLWANVRKLGMSVYGDELEVVHHFKPGLFREESTFLCPIVVRPRWTGIILAVFTGLIFLFLERIIFGVFSSDPKAEESLRTALQIFTQPETWRSFFLIAMPVFCAVWGANLFLLYRRSKELRNNFREAYPG